MGRIRVCRLSDPSRWRGYAQYPSSLSNVGIARIVPQYLPAVNWCGLFPSISSQHADPTLNSVKCIGAKGAPLWWLTALSWLSPVKNRAWKLYVTPWTPITLKNDPYIGRSHKRGASPLVRNWSIIPVPSALLKISISIPVTVVVSGKLGCARISIVSGNFTEVACTPATARAVNMPRTAFNLGPIVFTWSLA